MSFLLLHKRTWALRGISGFLPVLLENPEHLLLWDQVVVTAGSLLPPQASLLDGDADI